MDTPNATHALCHSLLQGFHQEHELINPKCRRLLIERAGFTITRNHTRTTKCEYCQRANPGVWS